MKIAIIRQDQMILLILKIFTKIVTISGCNRTRTHNHLVRKRTLNHLAKLAK